MFIWFPFFRFLTNEISDNSDMALIVRVDCESVPTVKFSKGEELPKLLLIENHSIEVGVGPKTTHWISCFFAISKVTSQGGRAQFWLIRDQSLFISGGGVCGFWLSREKMNLIPPLYCYDLPPPPSMAVYWQLIFYITPYVLCWRQLIHPQFPPKIVWSFPKKFHPHANPPPSHLRDK